MSNRFDIAITNEQASHAVDEERLRGGVVAVLCDSPFASADISIAVVDDAAMQELNRRYLEHDWPTDVLSFKLEEINGHLTGEIIISADTAAASAAELRWKPGDEQLLYVIHGALHLVGYRDKTPAHAQAMREAEARYLQQFGSTQPGGSDRHPSVGNSGLLPVPGESNAP